MPLPLDYRTKNPNYNRNGKGIAMVSNCVPDRLKHISELCHDGFDIDLYGSCHADGCNNIRTNDRYAPNWNSAKRKLLEQYSYAIAFENAIGENYVTEKLYDPLITHTLPYYRGAPEVNSLIPHPDAIITNKSYLRKVLSNSTLYHYHTDGWRTKPFSNYKVITTTATDAFRGLCERMLSKHKTPN
jgi:alpha-1,3-fucosyltransferase 10